MKKWFSITHEQTLETPALLVYPDRIQRNIDAAIRIAGSADQLRPHVKTHKMLEVGRMMVNSGIHQVKCATLAEAEMMAIAGATDILIAYQLTGPRVNQLAALKQAYPAVAFSSLVDHPEGLAQLIKELDGPTRFEVFVDVNVGQNRTGILPGPDLEELIRLIQQAEGIHLRGLHAYDGHNRAKDPETRIRTGDLAIAPLRPLMEEHPDCVLVAGGSPSFIAHAARPDRQSSPGTFVFWDHGYQSDFADYGFVYAAVLATRVISQVDEHTWCLDLGHKHVASEGTPPQIALFDVPDYVQVGHSEEHLVIRFGTAPDLRIGQVLYGVPRHICPTVALYHQVEVVRDNDVVDQWTVIARDLLLPASILKSHE